MTMFLFAKAVGNLVSAFAYILQKAEIPLIVNNLIVLKSCKIFPPGMIPEKL